MDSCGTRISTAQTGSEGTIANSIENDRSTEHRGNPGGQVESAATAVGQVAAVLTAAGASNVPCASTPKR
jgi:hypothetical protein